MNVFFDYQIFYLQRYGGISRYFYELAKELALIGNCNPTVLVPYYANAYISKARPERFISTLNPLLKKLFANRLYDKRLFANELFTRKSLSGKKNTILHETYYTHRVNVDVPRVITIHDMIYERYNTGLEAELELIAQKKRAILEADRIIAVSENTKKDLLTLYPEVENKTTVVYHGVHNYVNSRHSGFKHPKPFLLHVGNRGWYKNFSLLLEVFGEQAKIHATFDLICFGGGTVSEEEAQLIKTYKLAGKVHMLSGDDEQLISLYEAAAAFVYISNYEGFGMPVLEAMALSCPVLCSNTSSLPEVYGDAALAIDPKNKEALVYGLNSVLFDSQLRNALREKGLTRVKQFTWEKCAQETYTIYNSLI